MGENIQEILNLINGVVFNEVKEAQNRAKHIKRISNYIIEYKTNNIQKRETCKTYNG